MIVLNIILATLLSAASGTAGTDLSSGMKVTGKAFGEVSLVDIKGGRTAAALCIDGDVLYCGGKNFVCAFDLKSDPMHPALLSSCRIEGVARQMAAENGIVYVSCRGGGVWIVDERDVRNPKALTRYDSVELATGIDVSGNVLFVTQRQNGVEFVDVSDPLHPAHICMQKTSESQSCIYRDGVLYSGDWGMGEITVIDASDMSNVDVLEIVKLKGYGDGVDLYGDILAASTGHHGKNNGKSREENFGAGHGVELYDVSKPAKPEFIKRVEFDNFYAQGNDMWSPRFSGNGKELYCADTYNGLYAVDPKAGKVTGRVHFSNKDGKPLVVSSVEVGGGTVYATVNKLGLVAVSSQKAVPNPRKRGVQPTEWGFRCEYPTSSDSRFNVWQPQKRGMVRSVAAKGDTLFVACSNIGLAILKIADDGSVSELGYGPMPFAGDVKVRGGRVYVAENTEGLGVYEIDGLNFREVARLKESAPDDRLFQWVWTPSDSLLVVSSRTGMGFWDASRFPEFKFIRKVDECPMWDKYVPYGMCRDGGYPIFCGNTGIMWADFSGEKPVFSEKDRSLKTQLTGGVSNYKNGDAIATISGSLYIYGPGVFPGKDHLKGIGNKLNGTPLWDGGNLLSLTERIKKRISLLDMTDDSSPLVLWTESTSGMPEAPIFHKGRLIVPCEYQGLLIQK